MIDYKNISISLYPNVNITDYQETILLSDYIDATSCKKDNRFSKYINIVKAIRVRADMIKKFYNIGSSPSPLFTITDLQSKALRSLKDDIRKLKLLLPCVTIGGKFYVRREDWLITPSNILQIDIDYSDNQITMNNVEEIKEKLSKLSYILYIGLSVSSNGLWVLIPIKDYKDFKLHFNSIRDEFLQLDIVVDDVVSNIANVRYYSIDDNPYINYNATVYTNKKDIIKTVDKINNFYNIDNLKTNIVNDEDYKTNKKVALLLNKIYRDNIDITGNYLTWRKLAIVFANAYGDNGRILFKIISKISSAYDITECNKLYDNTLKYISNTNNFIPTLSYFFKRCLEFGITFK